VTAVNLEALYLHDAADLDDFVTLGHSSQVRTVEPRTTPLMYADGSQDSIVAAGTSRFWQFDFVYASDDELFELDQRVKRLHMLRAVKRGLRVYGFIVAVTDNPYFVEANTATITFAESTFREAS